jgi:hypothetical protein
MVPLKCQKVPLPGQESHFRYRGLTLIAGALWTASVAVGADLSQAVVRQKLNDVTIAPSLTGQAAPAMRGAVIREDNVVRTGTDSRADLEFADLTVARLGANSIFSFDAKARTMTFKQGAVLFAKPTNSAPVQLRSGAVSGAVIGCTGFISTASGKGIRKAAAAPTRSKAQRITTLVGMLEGKINGAARWTDSSGREHSGPFRLGPGEMVIARPDGPPRVVQFDIPRFLKTSPLINGFTAPLPNAAALERAVADYKADERAGFIQKSNVIVSNQPRNIALVGQVLPIDVVAKLQNQNPGGFLNVGSTGIIRGQLTWNTSADLDLYLTLPNGQVVSFGNVSVTFNNGRAIAMLDHDNLGNTIDVRPAIRVENIVVNGIPLSGLYSFVVNNFNSPNGADSFTLRVFYNGQLQVVNGTLAPGRNSPPVIVKVPHG